MEYVVCSITKIPMLGRYIGECMVSISTINNAIKGPTHRYHMCKISQISIFGGYLKVREALYTQLIIWVNIVQNHIDTMEI